MGMSKQYKIMRETRKMLGLPYSHAYMLRLNNPQAKLCFSEIQELSKDLGVGHRHTYDFTKGKRNPYREATLYRCVAGHCGAFIEIKAHALIERGGVIV